MTQDPWEAIRQISSLECPECGAEVRRSETACSACGAALPELEEETEVPLSVMAGGEEKQGGRHAKIPLEQSANLLKLRRAKEGILDGSLDLEGYKALVEEVLHVAHLGVEIFKTPAVKSRTAGLPADELELVKRSEAEAKNLHRAVQQMARFLESGDPGDVETGFREVEAAYGRIDEIQDQALEKSSAHYGS